MADPRNDSAATFVIIHAMGNDIDCWQTFPHFWRFLQREGAMPWVLPGDTGRPREGGWTVEGMADEIAAAFTGPLDLMGFANGGVIIQSILERHNERVRSAIIVNARFASAPHPAPVDMNGAAPPMSDLIDAGLQRWFSPFAVRSNAPGVVEAQREFLRMDAEAYRDFQHAAGQFFAARQQRFARGAPTDQPDRRHR